jgi:hypothetical protein
MADVCKRLAVALSLTTVIVAARAEDPVLGFAAAVDRALVANHQLISQ